MKWNRSVLFCFMFMLLMLGTEVSPAFARDDWQFWHSYHLKASLMENLQFRVAGEQRLRDDFSDSFLAHVDTGFLWKPLSFFEIGPHFRYEREKKSGAKHGNETRYYLEAHLKAMFKGIQFQNRGRIEYRNKSTTDTWRYRNRFKLGYGIPVKKIKFTPYVSEEIFFETRSQGMNQNRFSVGLTTHLNKHIAISLYYLLKSKRSGTGWNEDHVLGTSLGVTL